MQNLVKFDKEQKMTLKEITDLLGVDHSKAMKKVSKMATDPEFGAVAIMASAKS
jgi:hypothetical protein